MFLIKILKKDVYEMQGFEKSISSMFKNLLMNYKVGLVKVSYQVF